jgi:hypothetical protein
MAIDNSGSTGGSASKYWAMVKDIVKNAPEDTRYILWNSAKIEDFTRKEHIPDNGGTGCTDPRRFIPLLKNRLDLHLTLITDGQIAPYGGQPTEDDRRNLVTECEEQLQNLGIQFSTLTMYFISTDPNNQSMDLSVAAPFIRRADQYETKIYNVTATGLLELDEKNSSNTYTRLNLSDYADDPIKFNSNAERILDQIRLENSGRTQEQLRNLHDSLIKLQKNLLQKILSDKEKKQGNKNPYTELRELLATENNFGLAAARIKAMIKKDATSSDSKNIAAPESKDPIDLETAVKRNIQQMLVICDKGIDFS